MPLETATYINQLEPSNPAGTDQLAQGDDHLRMLKAVLKATFPNLTGPVTKTQAQLNSPGLSIPIGIITAWYGSDGTVPSGWAICNGQTVSRTDGAGSITTPNLSDKVIAGAGATFLRGNSSGSLTASANTGSSGPHRHTVSGGSHSHSATANGTALTQAQMPSHFHANGVGDDNAGPSRFPYGTLSSPSISQSIQDGGGVGSAVQGKTDNTGGSEAHSHSVTVGTSSHEHTLSDEGVHQHSVQVSTIQPSLALHYIMKV